MIHNMKSITGIRKNSGPLVLVITMIFFLVSCGSTKETEGELDDFRELVETGEFQIQNNWALPMGGGNINLIGNPNFIRFEGDSVDIFLPYFGVRHSGGGYGTQGGIEYEGPAEDLYITEGENNEILLNFEGEQGSENLNFSVTLYPNGNAYTTVTSSQRQSINYRGELKPAEILDEDK